MTSYPERFIIHFNVADFAVSVERARDSSLRRKPLIVASGAAGRSLVYDMSDEAYGDGVRKGMLLRRARRLCPAAVLLPPRPDLYRLAMRKFFYEIRGYSPRIEAGCEDGHFYLDLTGTHRLHGPAPDVGWRIRRSVLARLGINPIWSLGPSRLVSKVASRLVKPVGEYIVSPGEEEGFLAPLPLSLLPGLSVDELCRLHEFQVQTIGGLAALSVGQLSVPFGRRAEILHNLSRGIDVQEPAGRTDPLHRAEFEHHCGRDTNDRRELEAMMRELAARAGTWLRQQRRECRRVGVRVSYGDGGCLVRQASNRKGVSSDSRLRELALTAFDRAFRRRVRVRSLRLVCDRLLPQSPQLSLFPDPQAAGEQRLQDAMDRVRTMYGHQALRVGRTTDGGLTMNHSPALTH